MSFSLFAIVEVLPREDLIQAMYDAIVGITSDDDEVVEELLEEFDEVVESIDEGDFGEAVEDLEEYIEEVDELLDENDISAEEAETLVSLADLLIGDLPEEPDDDD